MPIIIKNIGIFTRYADAVGISIEGGDVLAVLDREGLHIELTESLRPGLIRPSDDADYLCVLMPMQVV